MTELPPPHAALVLLDTPPVPVAIGSGVHGLGGHTRPNGPIDMWAGLSRKAPLRGP